MNRDAISTKIPAPVTGTSIYGYYSHPCSYRIHLDLFGDRRERTPPSPTGRYLMSKGLEHEERVFRSLEERHGSGCVRVARDPAADHEADLERRAQETAAHLAAGAQVVLHGVLRRSIDASPLRFRGETDVLMRVEEPSPAFGAWSYVVGDVKSSRHARFPQRMQVAFYSWLMESLQGRLALRGFVATRDASIEWFDLEETRWTLEHFVHEELEEFMDPDRVFYHLEESCGACPWHGHCDAAARRDDDVSLVPGIMRSQKRALVRAGITRRSELESRGEESLRAIGRASGQRLDAFRDLKRAASAQVLGKPIVRVHPRTMTPKLDHRHRARGHASDLFLHRGAFALVAGLQDPSTSDDVMLAAWIRRRDDVLDRAPGSGRPMVLTTLDRQGDTRSLVAHLLSWIAEADELLKKRDGTGPLVVFVDHGIRYRVRQALMEAGTSSRIAARFDEAPNLLEVAHRIYDMPRTIHDPERLADVLHGGTFAPRPSPFDPDAPSRHPLATISQSSGEFAVARLEDVVQRYRLDREALSTAGRELRPLYVREWQESGEECWRALLELELAEDLRAADAALAKVLSL